MRLAKLAKAALEDRIKIERQIFFGEIDRCFEMGLTPQQLQTPSLVKPTKRTLELAQSLAPLSRRIGIDQIGDGLRLGEIELTGLESAPSEIARLSWPRSQIEECVGNRLGDRTAAMQMKFDDVFAGETGGAGKP